eukprot:g11002.t1
MEELGEANARSAAAAKGDGLTGLVTKPFSHMLDKLSKNANLTALFQDPDPQKIQEQFQNLGKTLDSMADPANMKAEMQKTFSKGNMMKMGAAASKMAVGAIDNAVQGALDNNGVNRIAVNKQLGDMSQQMTSDFIGAAWDDIKGAVPGAGPIMGAMEMFGFSDFIIQTFPKLLRLTFDSMFEFGPSWMRAYVQNTGGFTGAMSLFFETLELFSPKGFMKIIKAIMSIFTAKFWKKAKCSLKVFAKTIKLDMGKPLWDPSKPGAVACMESNVQYAHFAMPDPRDPMRRRELPGTTEKNWMACRKRC